MSGKMIVSSNINETGIFFDEQMRSLRLDAGDPVVLRSKSFSTFLALARHYPNPISKDGLIEEVWGQSAVSDDSITQCIADIRRALGEKGHALVQTNPGIGYSLTVQAVAEASIENAPPSATNGPSRYIWLGLALVILLLAALTFPMRSYWMPKVPIDPIQSEKPAVAVLVFDTLGKDTRITDFAEALRNDIVVDLSALDTVSVLSPSILNNGSTVEDTPVRAYAAAGAGFVVGGTIQSVGDGLRVSAHLINTSNDQIIWVRRWATDENDLLALQDIIGGALAAELANPWSGQLTGLGSNLASEKDISSLSATDHIRLGAKLFQSYHPQALSEAEQHFRSALDFDPKNAEAWAGLSFVLGAMLPMAKPENIKGLADARANSGRQAHHTGNGSGRSLLAGSWTAALRGNDSKKLSRLQKAVTKLRGDADAMAIASLQGALTTELYSEAIIWGKQAQALNTNAPSWYYIGPGVAYFFQGKIEPAIASLKQAPQDYPTTMVFLAAAYTQIGNIEQATRTLARLRMLHNDFTVERYLKAELLSPKNKAPELQRVFVSANVDRN